MKLKLNELGRIANPKSKYAIRDENNNDFFFLDENEDILHSGFLTREEADLWEKTFCEKIETYEEVIEDEISKFWQNTTNINVMVWLKKHEVKERIKNALLNEET